MAISFSKPEAPPQISFGTAAPVEPQNSEVVEQRVQKAHFALGEDSPGVDRLRDDFWNNREIRVREAASAREAIRQRQTKIDIVQSMLQGARERGESMPDGFSEDVMSLTAEQLEDPTTILERKFAKTYTESLVSAGPEDSDNTFGEAVAENPETAYQLLDATEAIVTRQEIASQLAQDVRQKYEDTSWGRWGWDFGKTMIPLYSWWTAATNAEGIGKNWQDGMGRNIQDTVSGLYLLPPDEFKVRAKETLDELVRTNIVEAVQFASALQQYSQTDAVWGQVYTVLDIADVATMGAWGIGKAAARGAGKAATEGIVEGAVEGARKPKGGPGRKPTGRTPQPSPDRSVEGSDEIAKRYQTDSPEDIARDLGITPEEVQRVIDDIDNPVSESVSIVDVVRDRYKTTPPGKIADDLGVTEVEVQKVIDDLDNPQFAEAPGYGGPVPPRLGDLEIPPSPITRLATKLRAAVQANGANKIGVEDALVTAGNVDEAAKVVVGQRLAIAAGAPPSDPLQALIKFLPGLTDAKVFARNAGSLAGEKARRLSESLSNTGSGLTKIFSDVAVIPRVVTPGAIARGFKIAEADFKKIYHTIEDAVVDVVPERLSDEIFGTTDQISVYIGTTDQAGFDTVENATLMAQDIYRLADGSYDVVPRHGNFYIRMTQPVDETRLELRDLRTGTDNSSSTSFINSAIGWLRSSDGLLSDKHTQIRKAAVFGGGEAVRYLRQAAEPLRRLSKRDRDRLEDIINQNRFEMREYTLPDGEVKSLPGNWYDTFVDYEQAYFKKFDELPSERETEAYFTFRQLSSWDFFQRNLNMYRDMVRQGAQEHSVGFSIKDKTGRRMVNSPFFSARIADKLPSASDEAYTVAFVNEKGQKTFKLSTQVFPNERKILEERIASGQYHIIQPMNPLDPSLREFIDAGGEVVNYIVTKVTKTRPLNPVQVMYRYGPHQMYPDTGFFVKQASSGMTRFGRRLQGADKTLMYFPTRAQAYKFQQRFNEARKMLIDKRPMKEINKFVQKNLPYKGAKTFANNFKQVHKEGLFDLNAPFEVTGSGQNVNSVNHLRHTYSDNLVDIGQSTHNPMREVDTSFTQQRDNGLLTIDEAGSEANPVLKITPTQTIDPFETFSRATKTLLNSRFLHDYKLGAVEDWAHQFANLIDVPVEELMRDPMRHLKNPKWKAGIRDFAQLQGAKNSRRAILQVLGSETTTHTFFRYFREKTLDAAYKRWGAKGVKTLEPWMWTDKTDPIAMARGAVLHAFLGIFQPLQMALQGQAIAHVAFLDGNPMRATRANFAAWQMRIIDMQPDNLAFRSRMANTAYKALDIPKKDFEEMYDAARRAGILNVEGELAMHDRFLDPKLIQPKFTDIRGPITAGKFFFNHDLFFFKEGNRLVRTVAFNTAYLAWREKNPTLKLTNAELRKITQRADLLSVNQTMASNAPALQRGLASVPTQFATFFARLSEQMLGGQTTGWEKARLMAGYSALYGVPTGALGTTVGVLWPVQEEARQFALENGWNLDDPKVKMFFQGAGGLMSSILSGDDMNFAERYGPSGMPWIRDLIEDKDMSIFFGASGKLMMDVLKVSEPFTASLISVFDPQATEVWPVDTDDFIAAARVVSSLNNVARAVYAWNTGELLTKNETVVRGDIDKWTAAFMTLTGMTPENVSDSYIKIRSQRELTDARRVIQSEAGKYYNRALRAFREGNRNEGAKHMTMARSLLLGSGMTPFQAADAMTEIMRGADNKTLVEDIGADFVIRAPRDQIQPRLEQYQRDQGVQ